MSFSVDSKVTLNFSAIRQLERNAQKALEKTGDALLTEEKTTEVMPFKDGNLQNENTFVDYSNSSAGIVSIVSTTPYARRLYFHPEYNFSTEEHIAAGGLWHEPWMEGGTRQNFCVETFAKNYRRLNGQ